MQEYIENENTRLEREHQFWAKEIIVRIEYKYCPNLSIIDTPGALPSAWQRLDSNRHPVPSLPADLGRSMAAPAASAGACPRGCCRGAGTSTDGHLHSSAYQCPAGLISAAPGKRNGQLQASARQVEGMVRAKMEQKEYIILCLEDTNDWSNATTRRLVMLVRSCLWGSLGQAGHDCMQSQDPSLPSGPAGV